MSVLFNNDRLSMSKLLVTGACGQIGTELVKTLRERYGHEAVLASDLHPGDPEDSGYTALDVTHSEEVINTIREHGVMTVYHLAAMLSAKGEQNPQLAWNINMQDLLNILEAARTCSVAKVFWPSSIAVFGPTSPADNCPQFTATEPSTIYGISKLAGEQWCRYYFEQYGLDVRSLRYPGLISHSTPPGGGTTDYAVKIFHDALENGIHTCFLREDTDLPMMYMPDAIRATIQLMEAPAAVLRVRTSYNLAGFSITPSQLANELRKYVPELQLLSEPDFRQRIADSWPGSIDDTPAQEDWNWHPDFDLAGTVASMVLALRASQSKSPLHETTS